MKDDQLGISGHVEVKLYRAGGDPEGEVIVDKHNDIHANLKNVIAESMISAKNFDIEDGGLFTSDTFTTPSANKGGIYVELTDGNEYDCQSTKETPANAKNYKFKGIIRASQGRTVDKAYIGNKYATGTSQFTYTHASTDFSPNISLANGDQLTINWSITLS